MRRLAAVLTGRRSDKSDAGSSISHADRSERSAVADASQVSAATTTKSAKSRSGFFRSLSKGSLSAPDLKGRKRSMPSVSTIPDHVASSASSSSGGPHTPNDDYESLNPASPGQGRKSWLSQVSEAALPLPSPTPAKPTTPGYLPRPFRRESDQTSETSSESESTDEQDAERSLSTPLSAPSLPMAPKEYFRVATTNALRPPYSPPPLVHVPRGPLFPRSCNPSRQLPVNDILHARVLRKRLLARLDHIPEGALAGFVGRKHTPQRLPSLVLDDVAIPKSYKILPASQGLRRWTERPCFEDRMIVYLPAEHMGDDFRYERVYASAAVEALGYSEHVEALAGLLGDAGSPPEVALDSPSITSTPTFSVTSTTSLASAPPSPAPTASNPSLPTSGSKLTPNAAYKQAPSPLRIGSTDAVPNFFTTASSRSASAPSIVQPMPTPAFSSSPSSPPPAVTPRPVVRFAQDDKDESIPLDYVMRIKQARDKKARFLAAERARRLSMQERTPAPRYAPSDAMRDDVRRLAQERTKIEEERKRLEEERRKWERERTARHAAEEQRKKAAIAEELSEARRRQEMTRFGVVPKLSEGMSWEGDRQRDRERRGSETRSPYARPKYDGSHGSSSPRQSSEPNIVSAGSPNSPRHHTPYADSSPGSSRPPSISSRPPSMYSTPPSSASATDIRTRRESKTSRRSFVSDGSYSPSSIFLPPGSPAGYPWGYVPPVPTIPVNVPIIPAGMPMMQVPAMPYIDMPLLPPTPPFVLQQYGPRKPGSSQRSHSSSPTRGSSSDTNKRRSDGTGRTSSPIMHRRVPSDDPSTRGRNPPSSSYTPTQPSSSSRSPRPVPLPHSHSHNANAPTPMVSSWPKQPAFQNLSRPSANRRQTMIT
ncbi:uncharacterized protein PHACADRAFT_249529 [Phanerochaete carnosa HHB-10118-sp]|uniref:Uncharacterized protein n=1 Tax=Phanerochaete carnosa (strain HHB-10118-sp) TaxID=650164 RepID=K5V8S3_PHACS|nr:uncharacterized protein PHACADRAFT_249529 [Phanerochaete carnosa HHB-10118-sp]EKM59231.1 hypothetical protein PHACADRAFT_249529 [Phanerochaete carnosa HHB-10118-sp]